MLLKGLVLLAAVSAPSDTKSCVSKLQTHQEMLCHQEMIALSRMESKQEMLDQEMLALSRMESKQEMFPGPNSDEPENMVPCKRNTCPIV